MHQVIHPVSPMCDWSTRGARINALTGHPQVARTEGNMREKINFDLLNKEMCVFSTG